MSFVVLCTLLQKYKFYLNSVLLNAEKTKKLFLQAVYSLKISDLKKSHTAFHRVFFFLKSALYAHALSSRADFSQSFPVRRFFGAFLKDIFPSLPFPALLKESAPRRLPAIFRVRSSESCFESSKKVCPSKRFREGRVRINFQNCTQRELSEKRPTAPPHSGLYLFI